MSIKFSGRYIPSGKLKLSRPVLASPEFLTQPAIQYVDLYTGSLFTAVDGTYSPSKAVLSRRWILNGTTVGTDQTITINTPGTLVLEVKLTTSRESVVTTTSPIVLTVFPAPSFTVDPFITAGSALVGDQITGNDGTFTNGTVISRAWYLNGSKIANQSLATITPSSSGSLVYEVKISGRGGQVTKTSAPVTISYPLPKFLTQPSVQYSDLYADTVYTASDGTWDPANVTVSRRWLLNGSSIGTGATVVPNAAGNLVLEVSITSLGGTVKATTSPLSVTVFPLPVFSVDPSVSPTSAMNNTLFTGSDGTFNNGTVTARRWYLNNTLVSGATTNTYTPAVGGPLAYEVTVTNRGGSTTKRSAAVTVNQIIEPVWVTASALPNVDEYYSIGTTVQATPGSGRSISSYTLRSGTLPTGVTLNQTSGLISGTISELTDNDTVDYIYHENDPVIAANVLNGNTSQNISLPNGGALGTFAKGATVFYRISGSAVSGRAARNLYMVSGSLPFGVEISFYNGYIDVYGQILNNATVKSGTYTFTIGIADKNGPGLIVNSATRTYTITVS